MTKEEVQAIIDSIPYERYGRVNLPYGLHTEGVDRAPTRNIIFPESLVGKSLLDVGSAYGYWSFEAEDLGAERIVGLETKEKRLKRANLFKRIRGSKAEFRNEDIVEYRFDEQFDYVLILNVLHHLKEHGDDVLAYLASKAKEKLIMESPERYRKKTIEERLDPLFDRVEYFPSPLDGPEKCSRKIAICHLKG